MMYCAINNHSSYSLTESALRLPQLIAHCRRYDMPAAGFCDTNNLFGALEIAGSLGEAGIQPLIGIKLRVLVPEQGAAYLPLYAASKQGYERLLALSSQSFAHAASPKEAALLLDEVLKDTTGLLAVAGAGETHLGQWAASNPDAATAHLEQLKTAFQDRLFIGIPRHDLPQEQAAEPFLLDAATTSSLPLIVHHNVFMASVADVNAHEALLCIGVGTTLNDPRRPRSSPLYALASPDEIAARYADIPEAVANTVYFAQRCDYIPKGRKPLLPSFGVDEQQLLREQAASGLEARLKGVLPRRYTDKIYRDRLLFELDVIAGMGFAGYFLIVADFIRWAKSQNIPVGPGRGSGAGSIVAWALTITDLDPLEFDLLFERFLNPDRVSMPDFDIDFCQDRRDEVMRYVQDKYGADKVAQIITFGKLQARAVLRDVGRVLDLPYGQVDRICKMVPNNPAAPVTLPEAIKADENLAAFCRDEETASLMQISQKLEGLYRHASTHAAGVVIGDRPLQELVPMYSDPRAMMPVTQFNMKYAEKAGLVKFDFLGLKTLTIIQKTVDALKKYNSIDVKMNELSLDDEKTFQLLARGDTTAVFQLESAGMRDALKKMRPDRFTDIIALVALYRPGPMDNIPRYIACKHGEEQPDYLHPRLEPVLRETFGVMIYQEQVMQAAQLLAGYTLGGADLLRRAMGKKIKSEMDAQQAIFVDGCVKNGLDAPLAEQIFAQIAKFADYGFNKSHAAAYALLTYQTAWLKANYPVEFMAVVMSYDMDDTDALAEYRDDCRAGGINVLPPSVNHSGVLFTVEEGAIRYALAALKGVGRAPAEAIASARQSGGVFTGLDDMVSRVGTKHLNKRTLESLVNSGACDCLSQNRQELFAQIEQTIAHYAKGNQVADEATPSLFGDALPQPVRFRPKANAAPAADWPLLEKLSREFQAIGFYLSAHPLEAYQVLLDRLKITRWREVAKAGRQTLAGVVLGRKERQSAKGNRYAFVQLTDTSGSYEVIVFSEVLAASREILEPGTLVLLEVEAGSNPDGSDAPRITVQGIDKLVDVLPQRLRTLTLSVDGLAQLQIFEKYMAALKPGSTQLSVELVTAKGTARLRLPNRVHLDAPALLETRLKVG